MDAVLDAPDAGFLLRDPLALQKRLLARAVPATAASARFVTVEAYEAAGGTLATQDLFVDETMLTDPDLLERLKNEKLARCADAIRRDEGWGVLVDPDLAPSLRREKSDFLAEEIERLKEIDDRLGAEGLDSSTWRRLVDERAGIQRLAALRAVKRSERHRYGLAVTLDDDGLFVVRALILPQRENQTDVPAARDQSPLASAEAGAPPLAGSPSAASTLAADGTISAEEHDWGDASGLSDAAFAAAAARAAGARIPSPPRDDDAPLPVAASRICEIAETKTISDVIAGDLRFAKEAHVAACARPGRMRVRSASRATTGPGTAKTRSCSRSPGRPPIASASPWRPPRATPNSTSPFARPWPWPPTCATHAQG